MPKTLMSAMFAVAASASVLAFAAGPAEAASREVRFETQDLATAEGRAAVDRKLRIAARRVCAPNGTPSPAAEASIFTRCYTAALADARGKLASVEAGRAQLATR
jgi:UrcA family protein